MFRKQLDVCGELATTVTFINDFAPPDLAAGQAKAQIVFNGMRGIF